MMTQPTFGQRTYGLIFAALVLLTFVTVGVSYLEISPWHLVVALAIAACKATLVALFFMHVLHSPRLIWLVAAAGAFWLAILLALTLSDYATRHW